MDPLAVHNSPETIAAQNAFIHDAVLKQSKQIKRANFDVIGVDDLALLFRLYDQQFFGGWLGKTVAETSVSPVRFRLSPTMTSAGGKTFRTGMRQPGGKPKIFYEIVIASRLLFMSFDDIDRPVVVCGLACASRLSALQRIMEHEIIHLVELLVWSKSSCSAARFKKLAANIFGHSDTRHALVTPREKAAVQHGITVGSMVEFDADGARRVGRVNRIHRRATVLVESGDGMPYSDGKRYKKWYVPLEMLKAMPKG